jgi:6-phosphogluconolactonase
MEGTIKRADWPRLRRGFMQLEVMGDAQAVAARAAAIIAENARAAYQVRGLFLMAVSGGHTPWIMLRMLAGEEVPWGAVHVFQVDERIAPAGDPDRNLTHIRESLLDKAPLKAAHIYPMPVDRQTRWPPAQNMARGYG